MSADENIVEQTIMEATTPDAPVEHGDDSAFIGLAKEYGWKPNGPRSAKEYILFALDNLPKKNAALEVQNKTIVDKEKKIAEMEVVLNQLAHDMAKQKEMAYKQAEADLKAQRREAIARGDADLVDELDLAQQNLKQDLEQAHQSNDELKQQAYNQLLIDTFRENNSKWVYGKDIDSLEAQAYARQLEATMSANGMDLKEQLETIEKAVQKKFPHVFAEEEEPDNPVESVQPSANVMRKPTRKFTIKHLNDAQKQAAQYLADRGTMTVDKYIERLVELGELK